MPRRAARSPHLHLLTNIAVACLALLLILNELQDLWLIKNRYFVLRDDGGSVLAIEHGANRPRADEYNGTIKQLRASGKYEDADNYAKSFKPRDYTVLDDNLWDRLWVPIVQRMSSPSFATSVFIVFFSFLLLAAAHRCPQWFMLSTLKSRQSRASIVFAVALSALAAGAYLVGLGNEAEKETSGAFRCTSFSRHYLILQWCEGLTQIIILLLLVALTLIAWLATNRALKKALTGWTEKQTSAATFLANSAWVPCEIMFPMFWLFQKGLGKWLVDTKYYAFGLLPERRSTYFLNFGAFVIVPFLVTMGRFLMALCFPRRRVQTVRSGIGRVINLFWLKLSYGRQKQR